MNFENTSVYWSSMYDLYRSYIANEKFRGISYQGEMNQYFCNLQIRFSHVLMNPLEIFLIKKWTPYVTVLPTKPTFCFDLPETNYIDINDGFQKIKTKKEFITGKSEDTKQWWKFPISSIEYDTDIYFTGSSILNVIGTVPPTILPKELKEHLEIFNINGSELVQDFLIHAFTIHFEQFKATYFNQPDVFTEAQLYNRYLRFISYNKNKPDQTLQFKLSHVNHDAGVIHFLNGTKETLATEMEWYQTQLKNGIVNPDRNQYVLIATSNLQTFFGLLFFTDLITANENFMIPASRKSPQILNPETINTIDHTDRIFHEFMIDTLYSSMKFLLNENKNEDKSSVQIDDDRNVDQLHQHDVNTFQIYGCIPGTAEIRYMIRSRGELKPFHVSTPGTFTKENERTNYPAFLLDFVLTSDLERMAKLISQVKQALSA